MRAGADEQRATGKPSFPKYVQPVRASFADSVHFEVAGGNDLIFPCTGSDEPVCVRGCLHAAASQALKHGSEQRTEEAIASKRAWRESSTNQERWYLPTCERQKKIRPHFGFREEKRCGIDNPEYVSHKEWMIERKIDNGIGFGNFLASGCICGRRQRR
jgi:hypothetical protein